MKIKLLIRLFVISLVLMSLSSSASEITQAIPANIKTHCQVGFIGEQVCKNNAVHQMYQNDACLKYDKIIKACKDGDICENADCVLITENSITGNVIKDTESKEGFFSRIWEWFKNLF